MVEDQGPNQEPEDAAGPDGGTAGSAEGAPEGEGARSAQLHEWLTQLQQMIDRVAHEATPVARQVAAKAAELAAVAGEKAGPLAKRAAEVTGDVGTRVAERGRRIAADLRSHSEGAAEAGAPDAGPPEAAADSADLPAAEGDQGTGL